MYYRYRSAALFPAAIATLCVWCAVADAADHFRWHKNSIRVGPQPVSVAVQDLNGDGYPEILTANRGRLADPREQRPADSNLTFLVGGPDLTFTQQPQMRTGFGPYAIRIANIDALKAPDVIVANFMATRDRDLTLLRNLGDNLFEPLHFTVSDDELEYTKHRDADGEPLFTVPGLTAIDIMDLNQDGYRDVVATAWSSNAIITFMGHAEDYFTDPVFTPLDGGPRDLYLTRLNDDDHPDAVVALYSDNAVAILHGEDDGRFQLVEKFSSRGQLPVRVTVRDMDGDNRKDIVVAHAHADDSIVIFFGPDYHSSQEVVLGTDRLLVEKEIRDMVRHDFDADGREDLALACGMSGEVVLLLNKTPKNKTGRVIFEQEIYTVESGSPRALGIGDVNDDNIPDLAVAVWEEDEVRLLLGR